MGRQAIDKQEFYALLARIRASAPSPDVTALCDIAEEIRDDFGALNPNGDMADFVYGFLLAPGHATGRACLAAGLLRCGYGPVAELDTLLARFAGIPEVPCPGA